MSTGIPATEGTPAIPHHILPYKWLALITASSANIFATVMMSIVNIALPSIADSFGTSLATVQWVIVVYPLVTVSTMLAFGYLGDRLGRKTIFTIGSVLFGIASLFCGLAQDPSQLIASRVLQAIGGSMTMANLVAIATDPFPSRERGKILGIVSTIAAIGLSAGPTVGGILIDTVGWRWVFFIAVPLAGVTAILSALIIRDKVSERKGQPFDVAGAALLFVNLASLLLALSEGQQNGWSTPWFFGLTVMFLLSSAGLFVVERRAIMPTVDLSLFRSRLLAAATLSGLFVYMAQFSLPFLLSFYLTRTAGYSPSQAGMLLTAVPLMMALFAGFAGSLSDRLGTRGLCTAGNAIATIALLMIAQVGPTADYATTGLQLLLYGFGASLFMSPNNNALMAAVPPSRVGMASAIVATIRHLGSALGVALAGAVFTLRLATYSGQPAGVEVFDAAASVGAFHDAFLVLALLSGLSVASSLVRGRELLERQ